MNMPAEGSPEWEWARQKLAAVWNPPPAQRQPKPRAYVEVQPGSRLDQLMVRRGELIAQLDDAKKKVNAVRIAIMNETIPACPPGTEVIELPAGPYRPALTVVWAQRKRFEIKRFHEERPDEYEEYCTDASRWEIRPVKEGQ